MTKNIYKYAAPDFLDIILKEDGVAALKCSYPKDFNDPFELFLTIDYRTTPDLLAYYEEIIGELPQLPTTCFSRSPAVPPMWAHYARNLQGFAIQFDEHALTQCFPESGFGDVSYRGEPSQDLLDLLERAYVLQKPRYLAWLQQGVFSAAYYTKATYWEYENERRMIVGEEEVRQVENMLLMDIPKECVSALITGPRATEDMRKKMRTKADIFECEYYEMKVGRSSMTPFFLDTNESIYLFDGKSLMVNSDLCDNCREPQAAGTGTCSWCKIDHSHREEASGRNTYRMLAHYGILDDYLAGIRDIHSKRP